MIDVQAISAKFDKDIVRIDRMAANLKTFNEVEFIYDRLGSIIPAEGMPASDLTMEFLLYNEALTTALVVAYGRLFARTTNTTQLDARKIPDELRAAHEEIIRLRNERYAHHGGHESLSSSVSLEVDGEAILLTQRLEMGMVFGAAAHWAPLFAWMRAHLYERMQGELTYLTQKSGVTWRMSNGPAPSWAGEASA